MSAPLSARYRTIAYSRRYNFPNDNPISGLDHSASVEARDLAGMIETPHLAPVHVVGVSYGALTALLLALERPELVRSLVLVEPPIVGWLPEIPGGPQVLEEFHRKMWRPVARALAHGNEAALRAALDYFVGPGASDTFPPEARAAALSNMREWEALTRSADPFPEVSLERLRALRIPVLMLSGEKSYAVARLVDPCSRGGFPTSSGGSSPTRRTTCAQRSRRRVRGRSRVS